MDLIIKYNIVYCNPFIKNDNFTQKLYSIYILLLVNIVDKIYFIYGKNELPKINLSAKIDWIGKMTFNCQEPLMIIDKVYIDGPCGS